MNETQFQTILRLQERINALTSEIEYYNNMIIPFIKNERDGFRTEVAHLRLKLANATSDALVAAHARADVAEAEAEQLRQEKDPQLKALLAAREEAEWLRDEEGKRNSEVNNLRTRIEELENELKRAYGNDYIGPR